MFSLTRKPEMRSNFNSLLVALALLDIGVVVTSIWDYSLVKMFRSDPILYTYMFPHFWYPLKNIIMTWTIFLTMGLSTERYLAVCRPIFYRTLGTRLALCMCLCVMHNALKLSIYLKAASLARV